MKPGTDLLSDPIGATEKLTIKCVGVVHTRFSVAGELI